VRSADTRRNLTVKRTAPRPYLQTAYAEPAAQAGLALSVDEQVANEAGGNTATSRFCHGGGCGPRSDRPGGDFGLAGYRVSLSAGAGGPAKELGGHVGNTAT
jgi:hypothetical protein